VDKAKAKFIGAVTSTLLRASRRSDNDPAAAANFSSDPEGQKKVRRFHIIFLI